MNLVFSVQVTLTKIAHTPLDRSAALVSSVINWTYCSCAGIHQIRPEIWSGLDLARFLENHWISDLPGRSRNLVQACCQLTRWHWHWHNISTCVPRVYEFITACLSVCLSVSCQCAAVWERWRQAGWLRCCRPAHEHYEQEKHIRWHALLDGARSNQTDSLWLQGLPSVRLSIAWYTCHSTC